MYIYFVFLKLIGNTCKICIANQLLTMAFFKYKQLKPQEERESEPCLQPKRLCQKLKKRIQKYKTLKKDFVFYFILADRLLQT